MQDVNPYATPAPLAQEVIPQRDQIYSEQMRAVATGLHYASWSGWLFVIILGGSATIHSLRFLEPEKEQNTFYYVPIVLLFAAALMLQLLAVYSFQLAPSESNSLPAAKLAYFVLIVILFWIPATVSVVLLDLKIAGYILSLLLLLYISLYMLAFVLFLKRIASYLQDVMALAMTNLLKNGLWFCLAIVSLFLILSLVVRQADFSPNLAFVFGVLTSITWVLAVSYFGAIYLATVSAMRQLILCKSSS